MDVRLVRVNLRSNNVDEVATFTVGVEVMHLNFTIRNSGFQPIPKPYLYTTVVCRFQHHRIVCRRVFSFDKRFDVVYLVFQCWVNESPARNSPVDVSVDSIGAIKVIYQGSVRRYASERVLSAFKLVVF